MSGSSALLLGQRRDLGRKVVDERRLHEPVFPQRLEDRRRDLAGAVAGRDLETERARDRRRARRDRAGRSSVDRPTPASRVGRGLRGRVRAATAAGTARANDSGVLAERHVEAARHAPRDVREHLLGQPHQVLVVHVRLVELEHRELGVVLGRDPLVAEVAVDLVDAFEPADGQALQVQLGRDAQEQIDVERVVMRDERPRERAAGDRLHHRRLDFEEAARVRGTAGCPATTRARVSNTLRDVRIDDQIEIALAVADLDVASGRATSPAAAGGTWPGSQIRDAQIVSSFVFVRNSGPRRRSGRRSRAACRSGSRASGTDRRARRPAGARGRRTARESSPCRSAHAQDAAGDAHLGPSASSASPVFAPCSATTSAIVAVPIEPVRIRRDAEPQQLLELGLALRDLFGFVGHRFDYLPLSSSVTSQQVSCGCRRARRSRTARRRRVLNVRASSIASFSTTAGGVSGSCRSSHTAMRRISRSITASRSTRQLRECCAISAIELVPRQSPCRARASARTPATRRRRSGRARRSTRRARRRARRRPTSHK